MKEVTMTNYCLLVKGSRKWYRADSASSGDREFIASQLGDLRARYPNLEFQVGETGGTVIAPLKYRPWAADVEGSEE